MADAEAGSPDDVWIAVMGNTGAGKSTFINCLSRDVVEVGTSLQSVTKRVAAYACDGIIDRTIWLVDTISFNDDELTLTDLIDDIVRFLNRLYSRGIRLSAILWLHPIFRMRFTGSEIKSIDILTKLVGDEAIPSINFVTTFWNQVNLEMGESREQELKLHWWAPLITQGSSLFRFVAVNRDAAKAIIMAVYERRTRAVLKVQFEMIDMGLTLGETMVGQDLEISLQTSRRSYYHQLEELKEIGGLWSSADARKQQALKKEETRIRLATEQLDRQLDYLKPSPQDIIIAVMGVTGAGKSTFIQLFTEAVVPTSGGLASYTEEISVYRCSLPDVPRFFLIDTPGFDDTLRSDIDVLQQLAAFLEAMWNSKVLLTGIIYLHSITETRFGVAANRNLGMFRQLCGDDALSSVVLGTTFWDVVSTADGILREKELRTDPRYWAEMVTQGSKIFRQDRAKESGIKILSHLFLRRKQVLLSLQRELVDEKKSLFETKAGIAVAEQLIKLKQEHEAELLKIREKMRLALEQRDIFWRQKLEETRRQYEADIARQLSPLGSSNKIEGANPERYNAPTHISGHATAIQGDVSHSSNQTFYIQNATLVFGDKRRLKRRRKDSDETQIERDNLGSILKEFLSQ